MKILCRKTDGEILEIYKDAEGAIDNTIELSGVHPDLFFTEVADNTEAKSIDECVVKKNKYDKLEIVRAFDTLDQLDTLSTFLNDPNNTRFKLFWDVASVIDLADADIQQALQSIGIDIEALKRVMISQ
jgi:hypothetical protein